MWYYLSMLIMRIKLIHVSKRDRWFSVSTNKYCVFIHRVVRRLNKCIFLPGLWDCFESGRHQGNVPAEAPVKFQWITIILTLSRDVTRQALIRHTHDDFIKWKHFARYWRFVTGEFPSQQPVTPSIARFFRLCLNKRLSKQSRGWWFETPSRSLWLHCNAFSEQESWKQCHDFDQIYYPCIVAQAVIPL